MFHIRGTLGIRLLSNGGISRKESEIKYTLNTEVGVQRFIEEMNPFVTITVKENQTDVTSKFLQYVKFFESVTNQKPVMIHPKR